jgi:hypothetical protein
MKKQLLSALIFASFSFNVNSDSESCNAGYDNLEHLGGCLGSVVDSSMGILADLPSDVQIWSDKQHEKAKRKLEIIKDDICNNENPVKEIIVEKIIYVDRIIQVPAKVLLLSYQVFGQVDKLGSYPFSITSLFKTPFLSHL